MSTSTSESDIRDIGQLLEPEELRDFYRALGLQPQEVEEEGEAEDEDLKARKVLDLWQQRNGRPASRQDILEALGKCQRGDAVGRLMSCWVSNGV